MLEIKKISKIYKTEDLKQIALDKVSLNFRTSEFVSILGPSGSGKTTLLNIIGGLDHYDSGDLIINEVSTKEYNDRSWDSYRNHRVGFVFQSYNLILHQTILQNVELALTLSGVSKKERTRKAKKALKDVGLEKHINKKPNQLSGGQMQRVAIARALVNNPDILLADEPTGALDSATSTQIMELLKNVSKEKLVIMVTHNPELATEYSTRIIKLKDGKIIDDSNPYDGKINTKEELEQEIKKSKKTSMNLTTALSLSLNNLMTKKGRTILTSFAGSIGIIGIALILSLSNGVQEYIDKTQKEALSSYPITIEETYTDITNMMTQTKDKKEDINCKKNKICTIDDISTSHALKINTSTTKNNLEQLKKYLDNNGGNINKLITDIGYSYNIDLQIYSNNTDNITKINPNTFSITEELNNNQIDITNENPMSQMASIMKPQSVFKELINTDDILNSKYNILEGRLPKSYNEVVLIVDENNSIPSSLMYSLDIENRKELSDKLKNTKDGEEFSVESIHYDYKTLLNKTFKLVLNTDYYKLENNIWIDKTQDESYMKDLINNGMDIKIVGILKVTDKDSQSGYIGYKHSLVEYVINEINKKEIAKAQLNNKEINVFTKEKFNDITGTYDYNCQKLGIVDLEKPSKINIYPKNFESKELVEDIIKEYNKDKNIEDKIRYTDIIGLLLSSVTSIVNVISYILIAFVAVSLIVSSIMISIITYISVLERTREIGILRAIGASKKDITRVFNAETIIEGFVAGLLGTGIAYLLTIPINIIVKNHYQVSKVAHLKIEYAIILIIISIILTLISGLIPSRIASKKDPVESLRSE